MNGRPYTLKIACSWTECALWHIRPLNCVFDARSSAAGTDCRLIGSTRRGETPIQRKGEASST
jgi:hypothetical protein